MTRWWGQGSAETLARLFARHVPGHWVPTFLSPISFKTPSANLCQGGIESWIDFHTIVASSQTLLPLELHKSRWILERMRHGGRVFVIVRNHHAIVDELHILHGRCVAFLPDYFDSPLFPKFATFSGGPKKWPWDEVASILRGDFDAAESRVTRRYEEFRDGDRCS